MVQRKKSEYNLLVGAIICLILGIIDIGVLNYLVSISECKNVNEERGCEQLPQSRKTKFINHKPFTPTLEPSGKNNIDRTTEISEPTTSITNCSSPKTNGAIEENKEPPYGEMSLKAEVRFATNQNELSSESTHTLETVIAHLNKYPKNRIRVEGYTDKSGTKKLNNRLSKERVKAVVSFLTKKGISLNRIESSGYGSSRSLSCGNSRTARAKNRRVEVWIMKMH